MSFILSVARRYLFATDANGRPAVVPYIGMVAVALGVMVLIVVNSIYAGYSDTIQRRLLATSGHIQLQSRNGTIQNFSGLSDSIKNAVGDLTDLDIFPVFQRQVLLRRAEASAQTQLDLSDPNALLLGDLGLAATPVESASDTGKDQGAQLNAYQPAALAEKFQLAPEVFEAMERGQLVLGVRLAQAMGVEVGDSIRVIAPPPDPNSDDPELQSSISATVEIGALGEFGLYLADAGWAVLSHQKASEIFKAPFQADKLEIFLEDLELISDVGGQVQLTAGNRYFAFNMQAQVARQTAFIRQEQQLIALVVGMTLLVASVGIVSGLVMLVHDKRREIAVLRTMGAKQRDILFVFLLAGGGIGLMGLAIGVSSGILISIFANEIRLFLEAITGMELFPVQHFNVTELPSKLEWPTVYLTAAFALGLSVVASLYPAWQASRVDPALGVKGV